MDEQLVFSGIQVHCKVTRMANLVENSNAIKNVHIYKRKILQDILFVLGAK